MNLPTKEKQTHRHKGQICGCQGGGKGLGLVDVNYSVQDGGPTAQHGELYPAIGTDHVGR